MTFYNKHIDKTGHDYRITISNDVGKLLKESNCFMIYQLIRQ